MGVVHGLQRTEIFDLLSALDDAKKQSCHPLLLPLLLCQLLVDGDANRIRRHAKDLYQVEFKTNFHGLPVQEFEVCMISISHTLETYNNRAVATSISEEQQSPQI